MQGRRDSCSTFSSCVCRGVYTASNTTLKLHMTPAATGDWLTLGCMPTDVELASTSAFTRPAAPPDHRGLTINCFADVRTDPTSAASTRHGWCRRLSLRGAALQWRTHALETEARGTPALTSSRETAEAPAPTAAASSSAFSRLRLAMCTCRRPRSCLDGRKAQLDSRLTDAPVSTRIPSGCCLIGASAVQIGASCMHASCGSSNEGAYCRQHMKPVRGATPSREYYAAAVASGGGAAPGTPGPPSAPPRKPALAQRPPPRSPPRSSPAAGCPRRCRRGLQSAAPQLPPPPPGSARPPECPMPFQVCQSCQTLCNLL